MINQVELVTDFQEKIVVYMIKVTIRWHVYQGWKII